MIKDHKGFLERRIELARLKATKTYIEESNKTTFFKPFPHQQKILDLLHDGKKTIIAQGANRIGKTVIGSNIVASACMGKQAWDGRRTVFPVKNGRCRIICSDWEHHAGQVIVPALKEWLPKGIYNTKKNNVGIDAFWEFPETGWTLELMTHIQDTQIHEGWKGHLVWADEPLPREKYIANKRGLIDYAGVFILTMTAVSASWILDDIVLNSDPSIGAVTEIPMRANPLLGETEIQSFESTLSDNEKIARVQGGWLNLSGRVLKEFDSNVNVIKPFDIPPDYPVIAQVDIAMNKPQAIGFYAWDKYDREFVIHEIHEHMSAVEMANAIVKYKMQHSLRLKDVYVDPIAKGDQAYIRNEYKSEPSFVKMERVLRPHGIRLHCAAKDKLNGVMNLQIALKGLNNMPTLYFFDTCKRHLWEIQRWVYDAEEKPAKENDDMMECLYRSTLCGVKYTDPRDFTKSLNKQVVGAGIV